MLRAYKYRIYPTEEQKVLLEKHFGCVRLIYNTGLLFRKYSWQSGVRKGYFDTANELKQLKKDFVFLKEVNSQCLQSALKNLDTAFVNMFKKRGGYPKFKSKVGTQSFSCPQHTSVEGNLLWLPKFDKGISIELHRAFKGQIKTVTISRTPTKKYFASILIETNTELPEKKPIIESSAVGIDLGIKSFTICSDGTTYDNPRHLQKSLVRLKWLQRKFSRKQKGSKRRNRFRLRISKLHEKVANQRIDFLHKVSNEITNRFDTICMEDLQVKNMVKNHKLASAISDVGWGMFRTFIQYKADWKGKNVLLVGKFCPSSKTCNVCGNINKSLTLAEREWTCSVCGAVHDRDKNASTNIKVIALNDWRMECACQDTEVLPLSTSSRKKGKRTVEVSKVQYVELPLAS